MKRILFLLIISVFYSCLNDKKEQLNLTFNRFENALFEINNENTEVQIKNLQNDFGTFNEVFETQIMQKGKNNKIPLRFMIISIDSFKSLNREFGFKATDEILSELAFSISSSINEDSPVIHIGGDEFLVALIDVERKTINDIVNEIRSSVEQIRISYTKENLGISIISEDEFLEKISK